MSKTKEQIERELRDRTRGIPGKLMANMFENPEAVAAMNRWMLKTHITWGLSLALTFVGLSYTLTWLQPPPWLIGIVFTPLGVGYMVSQAVRWRKTSPKAQSAP